MHLDKTSFLDLTKFMIQQCNAIACLHLIVQATKQKELAEALAGECVDLLAILVDLVRDEQRLQPTRLLYGLEQRVVARVLLRERVLAMQPPRLVLLLALLKECILLLPDALHVPLVVLKLVELDAKVVDALNEELEILL